MPVNLEDVKTIIRNRMTTALPAIPLVSEGSVSPVQNAWITENFCSMETEYAAESLPLVKGKVEYCFCTRGANSPGVLADIAGSAFQPHSAPTATSALAVFIEECVCSGIESEHSWRKVRMTIRFTAALK